MIFTPTELRILEASDRAECSRYDKRRRGLLNGRPRTAADTHAQERRRVMARERHQKKRAFEKWRADLIAKYNPQAIPTE